MEKSLQSEEVSKNSIPVHILGVQCFECFKWRKIPTEEEYEEIRSQLTKDPFVCCKKPGISCDDPADIEYNNSRVWVMDKPDIPKAPNGFARRIKASNDFSKMACYYDAPNGPKAPNGFARRIKASNDFSKMACYYDAPNGEQLKSWSDVFGFLEKNPEYKDNVSLLDFSFLVPMVREAVPAANPAKE